MHVPNYAKDIYLNDKREYVPPFAEFETLEELFEIPFVKQYRDVYIFTQYAKGSYDGILMAMLENNTRWRAIGWVEDSSILDTLPEWTEVRVEK